MHGVATGFPDGGERYTLASDGIPMLDCFVQYFDDRASFIRIRSLTATQTPATAFCSTLADEFPGLPIRITR